MMGEINDVKAKYLNSLVEDKTNRGPPPSFPWWMLAGIPGVKVPALARWAGMSAGSKKDIPRVYGGRVRALGSMVEALGGKKTAGRLRNAAGSIESLGRSTPGESMSVSREAAAKAYEKATGRKAPKNWKPETLMRKAEEAKSSPKKAAAPKATPKKATPKKKPAAKKPPAIDTPGKAKKATPKKAAPTTTTKTYTTKADRVAAEASGKAQKAEKAALDAATKDVDKTASPKPTGNAAKAAAKDMAEMDRTGVDPARKAQERSRLADKALGKASKKPRASARPLHRSPTPTMPQSPGMEAVRAARHMEGADDLARIMGLDPTVIDDKFRAQLADKADEIANAHSARMIQGAGGVDPGDTYSIRNALNRTKGTGGRLHQQAIADRKVLAKMAEQAGYKLPKSFLSSTSPRTAVPELLGDDLLRAAQARVPDVTLPGQAPLSRTVPSAAMGPSRMPPMLATPGTAPPVPAQPPMLGPSPAALPPMAATPGGIKPPSVAGPGLAGKAAAGVQPGLAGYALPAARPNIPTPSVSNPNLSSPLTGGTPVFNGAPAAPTNPAAAASKPLAAGTPAPSKPLAQIKGGTPVTIKPPDPKSLGAKAKGLLGKAGGLKGLGGGLAVGMGAQVAGGQLNKIGEGIVDKSGPDGNDDFGQFLAEGGKWALPGSIIGGIAGSIIPGAGTVAGSAIGAGLGTIAGGLYGAIANTTKPVRQQMTEAWEDVGLDNQERRLFKQHMMQKQGEGMSEKDAFMATQQQWPELAAALDEARAAEEAAAEAAKPTFTPDQQIRLQEIFNQRLEPAREMFRRGQQGFLDAIPGASSDAGGLSDTLRAAYANQAMAMTRMWNAPDMKAWAAPFVQPILDQQEWQSNYDSQYQQQLMNIMIQNQLEDEGFREPSGGGSSSLADATLQGNLAASLR